MPQALAFTAAAILILAALLLAYSEVADQFDNLRHGSRRQRREARQALAGMTQIVGVIGIVGAFCVGSAAMSVLIIMAAVGVASLCAVAIVVAFYVGASA